MIIYHYSQFERLNNGILIKTQFLTIFFGNNIYLNRITKLINVHIKRLRFFLQSTKMINVDNFDPNGYEISREVIKTAI